MEGKPIITVSQLFVMFFVNTMVITITYGTLLIGDSDLWDHLISAGIACLLSFAIIFPIYKLFSMDKKMNVMDNIYEYFGKFGIICIIIYVIYYLIVGAHTLAVFNNFISNAINPPISLTFLSVAITASACYGACKGLEALARASTFIFIATVISFLIMCIPLISNIEKINFKPFFEEGMESTCEGVVYMLSQASVIPAMAMLFPMARGNTKKGFIIWNVCVYLIMAGIITLVIGSMGDFSKTQLFPVYTAAGIGKYGTFEHLDSLYLGVWASGIFIKLSMFLLLAGEGIKKIFGDRYRKISVQIFSLILAALTFLTEKFGITVGMFNSYFLLIIVLVTSVLIPGVLVIFKVNNKNAG